MVHRPNPHSAMGLEIERKTNGNRTELSVTGHVRLHSLPECLLKYSAKKQIDDSSSYAFIEYFETPTPKGISFSCHRGHREPFRLYDT